ncbi:hypothetical protein TNCV_4983911 [Trichonephila clavipes]|nr:hypothetical protein TNCV_4983911 [Trichonephila clavipes]
MYSSYGGDGRISQTARDYADTVDCARILRAEKIAETYLKRPEPNARLSKPHKMLTVRKRNDYALGIAN